MLKLKLMNRYFQYALVSFSLIAFANAEIYPVRPIRLVVPYPPGGPADSLARYIAPGLTRAFNRQIVIDNRGGAGGSIGVETVVKSLPDGYTLLFGNDGPVAVNPSLYKNVTYNPIRDLTAISQLTSSQLLLVAHPSVPFRSISELISAARANPAKYTFASSGSGNASHLAGELLKSITGIQLTHVPYKGAAPALTDLISSQVNMLFNNLLSALPHVKSGKLIAIASTGKSRTVATSEIPTIMESGISGYEVALWAGILGPSNMPKVIVDILYLSLVNTVKSPDVSQKIIAQGVEIVASNPLDFSKHVKDEVAKWSNVVRISGARVD
jgi:tripartite-type tricarboxylate transporter receptor subunit TctC